ncbi:MAG: gliding motility lipoprotein GldH [Flavobacteriaceae bacterium]|nr:MAG: gliding motility lipoprotein GldH [Flavobacteriaceae bacterium]
MIRNSLFICVIFLFLSCDSNRIFDTYVAVPNHEWTAENSIEFSVEAKDTLSKHNVFIQLRNTDDFEFSTLFIIGKIEFPNGTQVIDTLEYEMADVQGKWLGSGYTSVKENKLFYKENIQFKQSGIYRFNLRQATRKMSDVAGEFPLKGISDVGLRIEKILK